jgi:hypothetical protein
MAIRTYPPPNVELRCNQNTDGTIDAVSFDDGNLLQDPQYRVKNGTCEDILAIYKRLRAAYPGVPVNVGEACIKCIPVDDLV